MSLCQHRDVCPLIGIRTQLGNQLLQLGIVDVVECILDGKGHRRIVDVLRSQSEMNKLLVGFQSSDAVELFLDEVFNGFHIVIGHALYLLHAGSIRLREITVDISECFKQVVVDAVQLRQRKFTQRDKILYFNLHTVFDKCIF